MPWREEGWAAPEPGPPVGPHRSGWSWATGEAVQWNQGSGRSHPADAGNFWKMRGINLFLSGVSPTPLKDLKGERLSTDWLGIQNQRSYVHHRPLPLLVGTFEDFHDGSCALQLFPEGPTKKAVHKHPRTLPACCRPPDCRPPVQPRTPPSIRSVQSIQTTSKTAPVADFPMTSWQPHQFQNHASGSLLSDKHQKGRC